MMCRMRRKNRNPDRKGKQMKIVFMGTPEIAVPCLEKLIESRHEVILVITQPDQKSGRGMNVRFSPVKETAIRCGIPFLQPENISDPSVLDQLQKLQADICAVAAYAQKIPDRLLNMPPYGCINMHPSLLPKYRGSGPLRGPILNGDSQSGVTIMRLVSAWDAGDILMQKAFELNPRETSLTLEHKSAQLGAELMLQTIDGLETGKVIPVPQDESKATYLKQIRKEDGRIDFSQSASQIERQIRACTPWPSAFTTLEGRTFKIWDADVIDMLPDGIGEEEGLLPGSVVWADKKGFLIRTGEGCLKPLTVQLEGKRKMPVQDFLQGAKLKQGVRFGIE